MMFTDDDRLRILAEIADAPYEPERWQAVMEGLALAGGGWAGQVLGISATQGILFNWVQGLSSADLLEFDRRGGGIPGVNPRVSAGMAAPVYCAVTESDFIDDAARSRSPIYQDLFRHYDADFISLARLAPVGEAQLFACAIRSERQGHATRDDVERMSLLSPAVSAALRLHLTLEGRGAELAAGALEALAIPAILVNAFGGIVGATPQAEAMLATRTVIRAQAGRLAAMESGSDERLQAALRHASLPPGVAVVPAVRVVLRDASGGTLTAEVAALPRRTRRTFLGPAVMIAFQSRAPREAAADLLKQAFGLTAAEAEIALGLSAGNPPALIAEQRGVSIHTIRNQLKSIYAKSGVATQVAVAHAVTSIVGPVDPGLMSTASGGQPA